MFFNTPSGASTEQSFGAKTAITIPGLYNCKIKATKHRKIKDYQICGVCFQVTDGESKGQEHWEDYFIDSKSLWRVKQLFDAINKPTLFTDKGFDNEDLKGAFVTIDLIEKEPYKNKEGKLVNQVQVKAAHSYAGVINESTGKTNNSSAPQNKAW